MTTIRNNSNKIFLVLTTSLLAFSFVLTPATSLFAQKTIKLPVLVPIIKNLPLKTIVAPVKNLPTEKKVIPITKFKKNDSLSQKEQLVKVREHILNNKLPQIMLDRLNVFEKEQNKIPQKENLFAKTSKFIANITDKNKERQETENLIKQKPFQVETFSGKINTAPETAYEKASSSDVKSSTKISANPNDYLAPGGEITFSQAIKDKTDALQKDPLTILNFVHNEVRYIPYYGSKKGADATLVELAGNDMDQASLLITMLRYSNIPARYRHINAKMDIRTVTDLLGVNSANAAAEILSLEKIPYTLYIDQNNNPLYFVVEHTYVEAYIPYGYSRGIDMNDGGTLQWVPMDPSINAYYYEQLIDTIDHLKNNGFVVENFFENYLNNAYGALGPLDAFKSEVVNKLTFNPPTYFPNMTYSDSLMRFYPKIQNLEFIPGSLPFEMVTDLGTYDYIPAPLRHTIKFIVKDKDNNTTLTHTAYVSDLADRELLVTYNAATPNDQTTINTFQTIYDVVPLSLVFVKPVIKVSGAVVATSATSFTLGQSQKYTMEFTIPTRVFGSSISATVTESTERDIITGNTNAIALNTDRVVPPELRPKEDTISPSFMSDQMLYRTSLDFLDRLQYTHGELANIIGGDFTHVATSSAISNGIKITYSGNQPYSFSWKGLRIDASSDVKYFSRFSNDVTTHRKEFIALFGLQASQDESNIFENNFNVQSVATVKGLKKVSHGDFSGISMKKITSANENEINSLNISSATKTAFYTAIAEGNIVYSPTKAVTYGEWSGLFYIVIDFEKGEATYAIGEGLNGGYSVCGMPGMGGLCNWTQNFFNLLVPQVDTNAYTVTISASKYDVLVGENITIFINFLKNGILQFTQSSSYIPTQTGTQKIVSQIDPSASAVVEVNDTPKIGKVHPEFDDLIIAYADKYSIPRGILKAIIHKETQSNLFDPKTSRYEPKRDYQDFQVTNPPAGRGINNIPFSYYVLAGKNAQGVIITDGPRVSSLPRDYRTTLKSVGNGGWQLRGIITTDRSPIDEIPTTVAELYANDLANTPGRQGWPTLGIPTSYTGNFTPQFLISSSYGLGHTMYVEATETRDPQGNLIMKDSNSPHDIVDDVGLGIELTASILKGKFILGGGQLVPNDNCAGWSDALLRYNGNSNYVTGVNSVCAIYNSNYK